MTLSTPRRVAIWSLAAIVGGVAVACQPSALAVVGAGTLCTLVWYQPRVALPLAVFVVVALRPFLDGLSARGPIAGAFSGNWSVVAGVVILLVAVTLWLERARRGERAWPDDRVFAAHVWLFLAYGVGMIAGWRGSGALGAAHGFRELVRVGGVVAAFLVVLWWVQESPRHRRWGWMLLAASVVGEVLVCVGQELSGGGLLREADSGLNRLQGTFSHPNTLGMYFVPPILLLFAGVQNATRSQRGYRVGAIVLLSVLLGLTYSRGALLGLAVGVLVLLLLRGGRFGVRELFRAGTATVAVAGVVWLVAAPYLRARFGNIAFGYEAIEAARSGVSQDSFVWRLVNWATLISMGMQHPIIGHGAGMTTVLNPLINGEFGSPFNAHNDFVRFFFESGAVGLMCYAVYGALLCTWVLRSARLAPAARAFPTLAVAASWLALFFLTGGEQELSLQTAVLWQLYAMAALVYEPRDAAPSDPCWNASLESLLQEQAPKP